MKKLWNVKTDYVSHPAGFFFPTSSKFSKHWHTCVYSAFVRNQSWRRQGVRNPIVVPSSVYLFFFFTNLLVTFLNFQKKNKNNRNKSENWRTDGRLMSITTTTIVRPLQKTLTCTTSAAHVMLRVYRTPATIMTQVKHLACWDINIIQIIFVIVSMLYYNMDTITALRLRLDWKKNGFVFAPVPRR